MKKKLVNLVKSRDLIEIVLSSEAVELTERNVHGIFYHNLMITQRRSWYLKINKNSYKKPNYTKEGLINHLSQELLWEMQLKIT